MPSAVNPVVKSAQISLNSRISATFLTHGQNVSIDLLLKPEWIIPVDPSVVTLQCHALAITVGQNVLLCRIAKQQFDLAKILDLPNQVVMPRLR